MTHLKLNPLWLQARLCQGVYEMRGQSVAWQIWHTAILGSPHSIAGHDNCLSRLGEA